MVELQDRYKNGEAGTDIEVPIGSLIGSKILSQSGPTVELTIIPVAVSKIDFITEFESQGINQTKIQSICSAQYGSACNGAVFDASYRGGKYHTGGRGDNTR